MRFQISFAQAERRKVQRDPCSRRAIAVINDVERGCDIIDFSARGARLVFGTNTPLPLRFHLLLDGRRFVNCQRIWQRDRIAGVQFEIS